MSRIEVQPDVGEIAHGPCTANVTWKIKDFFEFPEKVDFRLESPPVSFLGATWFLELWPNGKSENKSEGWIALSLLKRHSDTVKHQMQYTVGITGRDGSMIEAIKTENELNRNNGGYGWDLFYKRSLLQEKRNDVAPEGVLKVVCSMIANNGGGVEASVQADTTSGTKILVQDFKSLLWSEEGADLTLKVKNREFQVHRAVFIARSSVFCAKHNMKEKNSRFIEIDDCDPDAFHQFITYLYTGDIDRFSVDTVFDLYEIAHKYETQELKTSCVQHMMDNISVEIFCHVLSLSLKHQEWQLLDKAVEFFAKNSLAIFVTAEWLSFMKHNPVESNRLLIKAAEYNGKSK